MAITLHLELVNAMTVTDYNVHHAPLHHEHQPAVIQSDKLALSIDNENATNVPSCLVPSAGSRLS
jgi:hypothetical protein